MYDKRLDAVLKAAEWGSFSKAAHDLGYSTPALVKQIDGFESQTGVTIFERTNKGVSLTPAGQSLVEDVRGIIAQCKLSVQKATRIQNQAGNLVRVGVSLYQSGQPILRICHDLYKHGTDLRIQFVPVADTYESYKHTIENFGDEVDVLGSTHLPEKDERFCNKVIIGNPFLCLSVALNDELAAYDSVDVSVLAGRRVHVPERGNPYTDSARAEIATKAPGVEFVEFSHYCMEVFDECAMSGDVLLSKEIWRDVHPLLKTVDVAWDETIPYCLYYAKSPRPAVERFIQAAIETSGSWQG